MHFSQENLHSGKAPFPWKRELDKMDLAADGFFMIASRHEIDSTEIKLSKGHAEETAPHLNFCRCGWSDYFWEKTHVQNHRKIEGEE